MDLDWMKNVLYKMKMQWNSLKQGFKTLNSGGKGSVQKDDLERLLDRWGMPLTDDQITQIFNYLDYDKDGKVNFEDFQMTIGQEITPMESLYFRQDLPPDKVSSCQQNLCWEPPNRLSRYCILHH